MNNRTQLSTGRYETPLITGLGIITSIGQGKAAFSSALFAGRTEFGYLKRAGRESTRPFIGAEISQLVTGNLLPKHKRLWRTASLSTKLALIATDEAWQDAQLDSKRVNPARIGLVVGGSNVQQRLQQQSWRRHESNPAFVSPTYGLTLWDTDLVGVLSQAFEIQGEGYTVGSASASGSVAIIQAARQIQLGITDVSLAVGALFDLSSWECQALMNMGAMGSERYVNRPDSACRPFDQESDGFIYGEGCGVVVLEDAAHAQRRGIPTLRQAVAELPSTLRQAQGTAGSGTVEVQGTAYGQLLGWGHTLDGNRSAKPNQEGEKRAMVAALRMAGLEAARIDYVNTHGTGAPLGDRTEVAALKAVGLSHCLVNATKSLTGHGLTAAGVIEAIATLLQMRAGRCHPTHNLANPIDPTLRWVTQSAIDADIRYALSNSFAFGGINTALVFGF